MLRHLHLLGLLLLALTGAAQRDSSIYNDDPFQRLPLGTTESAYQVRTPVAGSVDRARVEPPNWWAGMQHPELELTLYDRGIGQAEVRIDYPGLSIKEISRPANDNYLFLLLNMEPGIAAGSFDIRLTLPDGSQRRYPYELRPRQRSAQDIQGIGPQDLIYLIMPDRFANGDPTNDSVEGMAQMGIQRSKVHFRDGGDLAGVIQRLDYLKELGVTAIWLNPVLENDQPYDSYHGYAVTDHYQIDRRFGTNEQYRQLVQQAHARGMKVVMDVIFNHVGDRHYQIKDLPAADWIHQWPEFTLSNFRAPTHIDPYASEYDHRIMTEGWFDKHMPDLNQQNPHLARYLIQNSIWWTAYSGHDCFRIDTYPYPDQDFMAEWNERMQQEFPRLGIFGEVWDHGPGVQAWFAGGQRLRQSMNTHLPGITDFQIQYAILEALQREPDWTGGVHRLYYTLTQDYLYEDPYQNVIFLDNHDLARYFTMLEQNFTKYRSGLTLLLTLRGIPMLYYGTEILLQGAGGGFGEGGRIDFPGGWPGDPSNKFTTRGRSAQEQQAYQLVSTLANYRKNTPALQTGALTQFLPQNGVYVFFRHDLDKTVLVAFNGSDQQQTVPTDRYRERMGGFRRAKDIISGATVADLSTLTLGPKESLVWELE